MKIKRKGSFLFGAMLSCIVMSMVAASFFTTFGSGYNLQKNMHVSTQAQQYAEIAANTLKLVSWDNLNSRVTGWTSLSGIVPGDANAAKWQYSVSLTSPVAIDAENYQRVGTVSIRKNGDSIARYSLQIPLSSQQGISKGNVTAPDFSKPNNSNLLNTTKSYSYYPYGIHYSQATQNIPAYKVLKDGFILYRLSTKSCECVINLYINDKCVSTGAKEASYSYITDDGAVGTAYFGDYFLGPVKKGDIIYMTQSPLDVVGTGRILPTDKYTLTWYEAR